MKFLASLYGFFVHRLKLSIASGVWVVTRWKDLVKENDGMHPSVGDADTRLLNRMRNSAVSAVYGAGMHPNRSLWVR